MKQNKYARINDRVAFRLQFSVFDLNILCKHFNLCRFPALFHIYYVCSQLMIKKNCYPYIDNTMPSINTFTHYVNYASMLIHNTTEHTE
jgi:hypothetical protein